MEEGEPEEEREEERGAGQEEEGGGEERDDNGQCCICLMEFEPTVLSCGHRFHMYCIQEWKERNDSCPVCRSEIREQEERDDEEGRRTPPPQVQVEASTSSTRRDPGGRRGGRRMLDRDYEKIKFSVCILLFVAFFTSSIFTHPVIAAFSVSTLPILFPGNPLAAVVSPICLIGATLLSFLFAGDMGVTSIVFGGSGIAYGFFLIVFHPPEGTGVFWTGDGIGLPR